MITALMVMRVIIIIIIIVLIIIIINIFLMSVNIDTVFVSLFTCVGGVCVLSHTKLFLTKIKDFQRPL